MIIYYYRFERMKKKHNAQKALILFQHKPVIQVQRFVVVELNLNQLY